MAFTEHQIPYILPRLSKRQGYTWNRLGIQAKILVPLALLMILSLLGSTLSFFLSTNMTRNRVLDTQLAEDAQRVVDTWGQREQELIESASLLANDSDLIQALTLDSQSSGGYEVLNLDRRVVSVRDRFRLDQVLLANEAGELRVNIATQSGLDHLDPGMPQRIGAGQPTLINAGESWILIVRMPIVQQSSAQAQRATIGSIYTILDMTSELDRIHRDLELASDLQISTDKLLIATLSDLRSTKLTAGQHDVKLDSNSYRAYTRSFTLGNAQAQLATLRNDATYDVIASAGFQVMFISSSITLLLLMGVGVLLARSFTKPILKLAAVAQAVADGQLDRRAEMSGHDEIGQLGHAFDHATSTIAALIDRQTEIVGELQAILHSITDGVVAVDLHERLVLVNPAAATLLEQSPEALIGRPLEALPDVSDPVAAAGLEHVVTQLRHEMHDLDRAPTEDRVTIGNRTISLRSAPSIGPGQVVRGAVIVLQDITREVAAERAKSDFITIASHEMRTPLTAIKGYVDMLNLLDFHKLEETQQTALTAIQRQTNALIQLLNDLLEMARIEQGSSRTARKWVPLEASIEDVLTDLGQQMRVRQISASCHISLDLPPLWIDALHLRRILTNLISNAVKYVYDGGQIDVRAYSINHSRELLGIALEQPWPHHDERSVILEIEDNGVGIRAEDQAQLFTRFFRSNNPRSTEAGGTGLGLTIVRALVQLHGGQIGFRSVEGQGSCFWVRFPIYNVDPMHIEQKQSSEDLSCVPSQSS